MLFDIQARYVATCMFTYWFQGFLSHVLHQVAQSCLFVLDKQIRSSREDTVVLKSRT